MCGICGRTRDPDGRAVGRMNARMVHRGPDDEGSYVDRGSGVALGARRLSIVDLAGGHQPLSNEDASVWVAFNGEIYNHVELRRGLLERGHELATGTDTEVLVHLYEELGDDLVHALEGMFAFAIWDTRRGRLLIGRDRFGEKPLFYREHGGELTFASELGVLLAGIGSTPELDPESVDAFFVFGYVPGPASMMRGIRQLPPAHLLVWERSAGSVAIRPYWSPARPRPRASEPIEVLTAEATRLLRGSIRRRLVADVPIGVLLSGGVDSTVIAALAAQESSAPVSTFTVGYDVGDVDESAAARSTAALLGTDHHELILAQDAVARDVPGLLGRIDQPLADQALVSLHAISRFARGEVKVAIGGEGADETFGGYPRYRSFQTATRLGRAVPPWISPQLVHSLTGHGPRGTRARRAALVLRAGSAGERQIDWVTNGRRHLRPRLYGPALHGRGHGGEGFLRDHDERLRGPCDASLVGRLMHLDQQRWLPDDVLAKADRASMLVGLELRTPYLDRELAEFTAGVDTRVHVGRREGKLLLRRILAELIPPAAGKRPKTAFRTPAADWLRGPLAPTVQRQLARGEVFEQGWLQRPEATAIWHAHRDGRRDATQVLWPLLAFGLWLDRVAGADDA